MADQLSNRFVSEEISGLEAAAVGVPPIFLAVAAFLLYIVISRTVQSEREEIGLMKAFGYTNAEVAAHYFKLILAIAAGGALAGCLGGIAAGRALIGVYTAYFKFPFLVFQLDPTSFATGVTVSILSVSAGGLFVLRRVFALTPATAMRPPAPPNFSRTGRIGHSLNRFLDQPSRMVLRRLTRQPGRMAGSVIGIASGMALSVAMITIYASFDRTIDLTFSVVDRSDVTVSFTHPVSDKTLFELVRLPGVQRAQPVRNVSVVLRHGQRLSWIGYGDVPELAAMIAASAFPMARIRHSVPDPEMHLHLVRAGAGMTFLAKWVTSVFPELQRVPGTALDQRRATWVLLHGELRRVRRVRLFVDYLCDALIERRAAFMGP